MILTKSEKERLKIFFSDIAPLTKAWRNQSEDCKPFSLEEFKAIKLKESQQKAIEIYKQAKEKRK